jgi:hypothetical protein
MFKGFGQRWQRRANQSGIKSKSDPPKGTFQSQRLSDAAEFFGNFERKK